MKPRLIDPCMNASDELERRVEERTAELVRANEALQAEIRERQYAEKRLRDSERLATMGVTVAKLVHEIANPLNGISTTVQLMERYVANQENS